MHLNAENGNTLWWDAILKEMNKNIRPAFEVVWETRVDEISPGYQKANQMFSDILRED